jgi:hypothetical protein
MVHRRRIHRRGDHSEALRREVERCRVVGDDENETGDAGALEPQPSIIAAVARLRRRGRRVEELAIDALVVRGHP